MKGKILLLASVFIFLLNNSCSSRLCRTEVFEILLPAGSSLEQSKSLEESGSLAYHIGGKRPAEFSNILLYPCILNPSEFLQSRHENNSILNLCRIQEFDYGNNKGVYKEYNNGMLKAKSYCFNQKGWTIIIENMDNVSDFQAIEQLVYSLKILKPLE